MKNENPIHKFLDRLFHRQRAQQADPVKLAEIQKFLHMVETTEEEELSCDEVFELLDQYVELAGNENDAASLLPLVKKHLDRCRDCHEEYEALIRVIVGTATTNNQKP